MFVVLNVSPIKSSKINPVNFGKVGPAIDGTGASHIPHIPDHWNKIKIGYY